MSFSPPFHLLAIGFWLIACYIGPNSHLWESGRIIRFPLCVSHYCNQIGEILMSNTHCSPYYFVRNGVNEWSFLELLHCFMMLCFSVKSLAVWFFLKGLWHFNSSSLVLTAMNCQCLTDRCSRCCTVTDHLSVCLSVSLQGSFVACMTATLRQMDDYHYAHLISTFGKMRTDVVVSSMPTKTLRNSLHPHRDISQTDIRVLLIHGTTIKIVIINIL